jgi:capsular polysaccharide biosynthesis protein
VEYSPTSTLVASSALASYQKQALKMFNFDVHYCDKRHRPFEVVLAAFGSDSGWPHPNDVMTLRKKLSIPELPGTVPIFISRSGSRRSDSSTLKLDLWASSQGLKLVKCEDLSWEDELAIFKEASSITGEHGGGLANLILAPKGTLLHDVYRPEYANPAFQNLSNVINDGDQSFYKSYNFEDFLNFINSN